MKKISISAARAAASVVVSVIIIAFGALCFAPERTVYLSGGVAYGPIYSGNPEKARAALMFNVYENADIVRAIVDKLRDNGVIATFFVGGCWADDNAETLRYIVDNGNELANHGYFHRDHKKLSFEANVEEISKCHSVVKALTGVEMNLFAPPSGSFGENALKAADKSGYKTIMWTIDTIDWRDSDTQLIYKRATEKITNGALILMHPKEHTLKSLDNIISFYKQKGIACVTVSECISYD